MIEEDEIEKIKSRPAGEYASGTQVVALDHHIHTIEKLFEYIKHIEQEWFTVKEIFNLKLKEDNMEDVKIEYTGENFEEISQLFFNIVEVKQPKGEKYLIIPRLENDDVVNIGEHILYSIKNGVRA